MAASRKIGEEGERPEREKRKEGGREVREGRGRGRKSELEDGLRDLGSLEAVHGLLEVLEPEGGDAEFVQVEVVVGHVGGHRHGAGHAVRVGEHAEHDQLLAEYLLRADAV